MLLTVTRRVRRSLRLVLIGTTGLVASGGLDVLHAQAAGNTAPSRAGGTGSKGVEQIVVTSQRRAQSIRKVPVSVTAISGVTLAKKQLYNIQDIATITPNVNFASTYQEAHIFVRGAGENLTDLGAESAVPIHLDDVYIARPYIGFGDLLDVQRVEVLGGPQGTLFGHNATGGVVDIIPNRPTPNFDAGASVTVGGGPTVLGTSDFVNRRLKQDGSLFGRLAVQENYNEGYFKNLNPTGPGRLNNENAHAMRAQLEWKPSDIFSTRLSVDFVHSHDNGPDTSMRECPQAILMDPFCRRRCLYTAALRQIQRNGRRRRIRASRSASSLLTRRTNTYHSKSICAITLVC